jgi:hypothetical protein
VSDRTYERDVASTSFPRTGLPDDPNLEMQVASSSLPNDSGSDHDPHSPGGAALYPEVVTWTDDQLVTAIELADRHEPALRLHATEDLPDRHEALLDACSAELVRRLEGQGVQMAA